MARRRLLKSYFYVEFNGQKYLNGGTITIPPFEATGGTSSFTVWSSKDWEINNIPAWLTLSTNQGGRGSTVINLTATTNSGSDQRTGELHIGLKYFLTTMNIDVDLSQSAAGSQSISITFVNDPIGASVTSNMFTLNCTNIDLSTLGYYADGSTGINSCNLATSSVTISENTAYTDRTITLAITGTSTVGNPVTGTAQFTQSKKIVTPSLGIAYTGGGQSAAAGSTNAFTLTKNYIDTITAYSVSPNTATATTTGQTGLTVQYPANQTENAKQYTVSVTGTDVYGAVQTASTTFSQAADSYTLSITPGSYTAAATDASYGGFVVSSSNVSNTGLSYTGAITGATRTGNNITVNFGQNQTSSSRSGSVTITGTTVGGRSVSAVANLTQNAASTTSLSIVYTGGTLTSQAGSTTAFTVTSQNVTVTEYTVDNSATATTLSSGVSVAYPANPDGSNSVTYTITVWGTNEFSQTVSASTTFSQAADSYTLVITPASVSVAATATSYNSFTVSSTNISNTGLSSDGIITAATRSGNNIIVNFEQNQTSSPKTGSVTITGTTLAGRSVSATGSLSQAAAGQVSLTITYTGSDLSPQAGSTTAFTVTSQNVTVTGYTVNNNATATTIASGVRVDYPTNSDGSNPVYYTVTVWALNEFSQTVSASCQVTQVADSYTLVITPASYTALATDASYSGFTLSSSNVSNTGLTYAGAITAATITGSNITVDFGQNQGSTTKTGSVTITGTTRAGRSVSTSANLSQNAASITSLVIAYTGSTLIPGRGVASAFTVTALNVTVTGYTADNGASIDATTGAPRLIYPANTDGSNPVVYTVTVWGTNEFSQTVSASCQVTQVADSYTLTISPASYTALATDTWYSGFTISSSNVSNTGLSYNGMINTATRSGNNIVANFDQNQTSNPKTGSVTITAATRAGRSVSASANLSQNAASITSLVIAYTGSTLIPGRGVASAFTVTALNVTVTGYTADNGASIDATTGAPRLIYPANTDENNPVTYTVTVWALDEFSQTLSASCQVEQAADSYTLSITPASYTAAATATSYNGFTVTSSNVSNTGLTWTGVITSASRNGNSITVNFEENQTTSVKSGSVTITGTTVGGRTVSATANLTQNGVAGSLTLYLNNTHGDISIGSAVTSFSIKVVPNASDFNYLIKVNGTTEWSGLLGETTHTYSCGANPNNTSRTFTVIASGSNSIEQFTVTQSAKEAFKANLKINGSTNPSNISSATTGFTVSTEPNDSSVLYTVKVGMSGTILTSTTGNFSVVHSIGENPLTDARQYTVYVIVDDTVVESVSITQDAKAYYTIAPQYCDGNAHDTIILTADTNMVGTFYVSYDGTEDVTATISSDGETITVSGVPEYIQTSGDSSSIQTRGFHFLIRINTTEGAPLAVGILVQTANVFMWKISDNTYNSQYSIYPDATYHEYTFEFVSNYPTLKFVETSWLSVDDSEPGEAMVTIDANGTTSDRSHGITVYTGTSAAGSAVGVLIVRQGKATINLNVNGDSGSTNIGSGDTYFNISTSPTSNDVNYSIYIDNTAFQTNISGSKNYTYTCGSNTSGTERTMVVRIITGSTATTYESVTVRQAAGAKALNLKINGSTTPSDINSGTTRITITTEPNDSTLSYRVYSSSQTYITNQTGNYSTIANIGANTATTQRFITITAKSMDNTVTERVTIKQHGKSSATYTITIQGYNDDVNHTFQGVNNTSEEISDYVMYIDTSIARLGNVRYIDIPDYGQNSFALNVSGSNDNYTDNYCDITLSIKPRSTTYPTYCKLEWSPDNYSEVTATYDSYSGGYKFDTSLFYGHDVTDKTIYIKKITFSNN